MRLTLFPDTRRFLEAVGPELGTHEIEHHLMLGVATSITPSDEVAVLAAVHDGDGLVLAALMLKERPLVLASDRADTARAAGLLCEEILPAEPRQAIGAVAHVEAFGYEWTRRTARPVRLRMHQRLYSITHVRPPPAVSGAMRVATEADLDLVQAWKAAFEDEVFAPAGVASAPPAVARAGAQRRIRNREIYLWTDPDPRAMAGWARPTVRGVAVNSVYTPRQWRGRGYATACVAELTARLLDGGRAFCVLYTDVANPTSNAIYTRIGYQPVLDQLMYDLGA